VRSPENSWVLTVNTFSTAAERTVANTQRKSVASSSKAKKSSQKKSKKKGKKVDPLAELSLKERLAIKRQRDRLRKEFVSFTAASLAIALLIGGLLSIVGGVKAFVGATVGVMVFALSFKYPRHALWALLIYMPFSGTVIYALGNSPVLQLAKDAFYFPALVGVIQYCRREKLPLLINKTLLTPLIVLIVMCLFTFVFVNCSNQFLHNTKGGSPMGMGILGFKIFLGYIPLMICSFYLLRDRNDLLFLMRLNVVIMIICCGLGFAQYMMLSTGICEGTRNATGNALFKANLEARCLVGGSLLYSPSQGQIRLPGTFVAPWQWGWYLISGAFLAFSSAFNDPKPLWRLLGLLALVGLGVMAMVSGQRIALVLVPTVVVLLLVLTGQVTNLKRLIPIAVGLGLTLGVAAIQYPEVVQERLDSLFGRWDAAPPQDFIVMQFQWAIKEGGLLGEGLGRATNAARVMGPTELVETYYPKLIFEIGPFGTLAFLAFVTVLSFVSFQAYRACRDRTLRSYGAPLWLFIVFISYNTYYYPLDVDPVAVYYWFFAGVVLRLPTLEKQEKQAAIAAKRSPGKPVRTSKKTGFG
jgi:Cell cycle protein